MCDKENKKKKIYATFNSKMREIIEEKTSIMHKPDSHNEEEEKHYIHVPNSANAKIKQTKEGYWKFLYATWLLTCERR